MHAIACTHSPFLRTAWRFRTRRDACLRLRVGAAQGRRRTPAERAAAQRFARRQEAVREVMDVLVKRVVPSAVTIYLAASAAAAAAASTAGGSAKVGGSPDDQKGRRRAAPAGQQATTGPWPSA